MALPKNVYKLSCPYWKRNVASIAESQDINSRTFDTFQSAKLNFEFDIQKSPLNSENYCAVLKGKPIKSPSSKILEFQTEDVAHLLALEWNASVLNQKDFTHSRPITSLAFRAAALNDGVADKEACINSLLAFIETDTLCFWDDSNSALGAYETLLWGPIVAKLNEVFQIDLRINHGGFSVLPQDEKTFRNIRIYFESLNGFQLAAAERVIHDMKSVMLGLAYMRNLISVEDVIKAAHLELFFQSQKWGLVEDVHEVELARLRQNLYLAKIIV